MSVARVSAGHRSAAESESLAAAPPNLALSKYWGKLEGEGNFPAVPSLSVTLGGLETQTLVRFDDGLGADTLVIDGSPAPEGARARAVDLLDRVRAATGEVRHARIHSRNSVPIASGLASSASGFAALALAATRAAGLDWPVERVSDLARRSSASAARSLFAGFVELEAGQPGAAPESQLAARQVAPADHLPLAVLVCVTADGPKAVGSSDGMRLTMAHSPYARAWLEHAPRLHARLRDALLQRDLPTVGELAEASAVAMHASAIAAGVTYWNGVTLDVLSAVRGLRAERIDAFASIDAGPHVKVLVTAADVARVQPVLQAVPGVRRVIDARPGEGASVRTRDARTMDRLAAGAP